MESSPAIVIHKVQYADHAAIVRCFTRTHGYESFMIRGLASKKQPKAPLLQPFTLVELDFSFQESREIQSISGIRRAEALTQLQTDFTKMSIAMFCAEFVYRTFEPHYRNASMFDYMREYVGALNRAPFPANLHLKWLIDLTGHFGIQPKGAATQDLPFLDFERGEFVRDEPHHPNAANAGESRFLRAMLQSDLTSVQAIQLDRNLRSSLLDRLLDYYQVQFNRLIRVNSRDVLKTLFDA